jgi:hypothetical protein
MFKRLFGRGGEAAIPMSKIDPATMPSDAGGRLH